MQRTLEAIKSVQFITVNGGPKVVKILTQYGCLHYFSELAKSAKSEDVRVEAEEVIKMLLAAGSTMETKPQVSKRDEESKD
jgi:hypothetical protein